jgi:hypothetical protein
MGMIETTKCRASVCFCAKFVGIAQQIYANMDLDQKVNLIV